MAVNANGTGIGQPVRRREDLRQVFKPELSAAPKWAAPAAEAVTSGAFWDELRRDQKLPKAAALEAMREALSSVLGAGR